MKTLKFLKRYSQGNIGRILGIVCADVAYIFFAFLTPLIIALMVDNVIDDKEVTNSLMKILVSLCGGIGYLKTHMWVACMLLAGSTLVSGVCLFIYKRGSAYLAENVAKKLKDDLFTHIMHLPYAYYVSAKNGDLVQRCTSDVDQVRAFYESQISEVVSTIGRIIVAITILAGIHKGLLGWSMITFPFTIIFSFLYYKNLHKVFDEFDQVEGELNSMVEQDASGVRVVKAFDREREEIRKFDEISRNYQKHTYDMILQLGNYWSITGAFSTIQELITILMGIMYTQNGSLSLGNYYVFISYIGLLIWPIRNLGRTLANIGKMNVAIKRMQEIFDEEVEDMDSGITHTVKGAVELKDVYFKYDEATPVLNGVSFKVNPGEVIAIMGPTGCGKSSLIHLLTRLYDYEGSITMDGVELDTINRGNLRNQVGIVLQEPFLFSKSIKDNIMMASRQGEEAMYEACRIASAEDFIASFEKKYDTEVGEKGVTLSGGQKQRIAIARTIVNGCPIIMFDDSLSALDAETDAAIRKELHNLPSHPTIFIITHRVISARDADKIVVLEDGKITQMGTHDELINSEGLYKRIANIQSQLVLGGEE